MNPEVVPLLCSPKTREPLELTTERRPDGQLRPVLRATRTGESFPLRDGIPVFLDEAGLTGLNKKYQVLYDRIARFYDLPTRIWAFFKTGGEANLRRAYLRHLEIKPGDRVLEVSVGTGSNLRYLPAEADYFGLDISWGMLRQCRRQLRRWGRQAELFLGEAERLPFRDEVFDVVFHVGGINFFNDRAVAIREMVRVAKPGTKFIVADETEKLARTYERAPLTGKFYRGRPEQIAAPVDLLPEGMEEVAVEFFFNQQLYCIVFRKPRSAGRAVRE
jgi:ubiquinone/menaquinone biosynthesis C-methylase UbiE/uncharacterized protein YbaR (Trm112 family)